MNGFSGVVDEASNIRVGGSTEMTQSDFVAIYPQFTPPNVPQTFLTMIISQANSRIGDNRWHSDTAYARALYVAHMCTLYMKGAASATDSPSVIVTKGDSRGAQTSKSVGGVSVSYGSTSADNDLQGYGSFRDTIYGQLLCTLAKQYGFGMMVVR